MGNISLASKISPRHVLVVDDEPLIRWSVAVVVLDLRLPDMEDLSLLGTLRQLLPAAGLVLMTAFGTPEIVSDATALGATVIGKPFELDELKRLVIATGSQRD